MVDAPVTVPIARNGEVLAEHFSAQLHLRPSGTHSGPLFETDGHTHSQALSDRADRGDAIAKWYLAEAAVAEAGMGQPEVEIMFGCTIPRRDRSEQAKVERAKKKAEEANKGEEKLARQAAKKRQKERKPLASLSANIYAERGRESTGTDTLTTPAPQLLTKNHIAVRRRKRSPSPSPPPRRRYSTYAWRQERPVSSSGQHQGRAYSPLALMNTAAGAESGGHNHTASDVTIDAKPATVSSATAQAGSPADSAQD